MPALRRGRTGSRIIVTGSDKHVVDLGTTEPIILRPLPPEEYWFFFKAHAFGGADDAEADPRLAAEGQAIARRLRLRCSFIGDKAVGALLRSRPDHRLWRRVLAASHAESSWFANGDYSVCSRHGRQPPPSARDVQNHSETLTRFSISEKNRSESEVNDILTKAGWLLLDYFTD
ncbi:unnamed protein product [Miscanthus lutarioriparius]|uniref:NB-ARC domain-containing protein n=1 Tax=Miscanthus lutarioriparius TaxID=422564 RepID=A0A811PVR2_9POAL|nr:unnamed protein product [Miscanthus lutarioriparius]